MPSSSMSKAPPTLRKTLRKVIISLCRAPATKMSPSVARAADGPAGDLVAVEQRAVLVSGEVLDALDEDDPVRLHRDDGAHLLQDRDEVHDLGLDGRVLQLGDAGGAHGGEQHLFGGPDARIRQVDVGADEAVRAR